MSSSVPPHSRQEFTGRLHEESASLCTGLYLSFPTVQLLTLGNKLSISAELLPVTPPLPQLGCICWSGVPAFLTRHHDVYSGRWNHVGLWSTGVGLHLQEQSPEPDWHPDCYK